MGVELLTERHAAQVAGVLGCYDRMLLFGTCRGSATRECEYATDVVFRKQADLQSIYGNLTRTAIHTVKPDNIATF